MFNGGGYHMGGMHSLWWIFWVLLVGVLLFFWWGGGRARSNVTIQVTRHMMCSNAAWPAERLHQRSTRNERRYLIVTLARSPESRARQALRVS